MLCVFASIAGLAQGSVSFITYYPLFGVNAPFYDYQGRPLLGPDYVAQMYAGQSANSLTPVGAPVGFGLPDGRKAGYVFGDIVEIPFIHGFDPVWVQVRAWAVAGGATYEQAVAAGAYTGLSNVLFLPTTGDPSSVTQPALMVGLQFVGVPEPAPWQLGLFGFGALALLPHQRSRVPGPRQCC
jgi:hypothetical protein